MYDIAIIGSGITGAATAYTLSQYDLSVVVLEKHNDIAMGATRANSAIIHAGYDPEPGTLMARLNVRGCAMAEQLCRDLDVPYKKVGSLVLAFSEEEMATVRVLYDRGVQNGVPDQKILSADEVHALEPEVSDQVVGALYAPSAGIISPWEYALAFAETAAKNGVTFRLNSGVTAIEHQGDGYLLHTASGDVEARRVINAAGTSSDAIHEMVAPKTFTILPNRGEYYLLDKCESVHAHHVLFQEPPQTLPSSSLIATPDSNFLFRFEIQDSVSKEPIVFANILVKKEGKTIIGATTDFDGRASIVVPRNDTYDIEISMVGYHKLTLANIEPTPSDDTSFVKLQLRRSSQTTIGLIQAEAVGKIYESDDAEQTIDTSSAVKVESLRHKRKHTLRNQNK